MSELKFLDYNTEQASTGLDCISEVAQGTGQNQRIGRRILVHSLQLQITLDGNSGGGDSPANGNLVRVILYIDHQKVQETNPVITDVFESDSVYSFPNLANSERFEPIFDMTRAINYSVLESNNFTADTGNQPEYPRWFPVLRREWKPPLEMVFSGTAGDTLNGVSLLLVIYDQDAGGLQTTIDVKARIRFSD